ncbi:hypothetical protein BA20089_04255 [Bifidobacterium asteroides DSM 20089]|uniref:Uncharacterized protein n=1 Tax=Bifidobacterium asteroides DSM 20089 TaxID=1437594 RepID=A0AAD0A9X4_9BIFI|nr:hypothetical protein BA20089_04255 [Bifidobacterium asteroides DSM 20089]
MQSEDERPLNIPTKIIPYEPIGIGQIPSSFTGTLILSALEEWLLIVIIRGLEMNSGQAG